MKLLSLTICNYKNYCGDHTVDFDTTDPEKNITLIGGMNGGGKTTLFESIKLCMFGYQFGGMPIPKQQYQDYLRGCWNKTAVKEGDTRYYIKMDVILDDVEPVYTVTLKREWKITDKSFDEKFTITRDGLPFEIVEEENWQQYIYDMFPPYTIEYFFFDGEKMQGLISGGRAETILRDSARDLIGLKIYDTLLTDIGSLKDKIRKSTKKDEKNKEEYDRLTDEVEKTKNQLDSLTAKKEKLEEGIKVADAKIEEIRDIIQRKAGAYARSHDMYQAEVSGIQTHLADLNTKISDTAEYVPFIMAGSLMQKSLDQLNAERAFRESTNDLNIVEKIREHLTEEFSGNKSVLEKVNTTLDAFKDKRLNAKVQVIHDASNSVIQHFSEFLEEIRNVKKQEFLSLLKDREESEIKLQKLQADIKKMPDTVFIEEELAEVEKLKKSIEKAHQDIGSIREEIGRITPEYEVNILKLNNIDTESLKRIEDKEKYLACEKLESILTSYINYTLMTKVKQLETIITSMYKTLENKEDLVEKMQIDPATFEITLIGFDGNVVNKNNLSSGEKEIYALSILWGLSQLSKSHLPIVVDSLLARLDHSHVGKIATTFLPNAGKQVLILSHSREVNKELYPIIKPKVSAEYLLSYDQKHKLSKGYFTWEDE